MYNYDLAQWLLFFYIYCFIGWVWESCYVSVKKRKWVNRGFIHGPFLPLYGSGAIIVLLLTIPVRDNFILVFLFGMIGATILEYITGAVMEKLFNVRYWDYSKNPFNINGHICLGCSIAWGFFSLGMINIFHKPFETLVLMLPEIFVDTATLVITVVFVVDFTLSFMEALDLKEMLARMKEDNDLLRMLENRMDAVSAFVGEEIRQTITEKATDAKLVITEKASEAKQAITEKAADAKQAITEKAADAKLSITEKSVYAKQYSRSLRMLKRNPDAISKQFGEILGEVKEKGLHKKKM